MLAVLRAPDSTPLLIDEIDRADQESEVVLPEFLSDFQISISIVARSAPSSPPSECIDMATPHLRETLRLAGVGAVRFVLIGSTTGPAKPIHAACASASSSRQDRRTILMRAPQKSCCEAAGTGAE